MTDAQILEVIRDLGGATTSGDWINRFGREVARRATLAAGSQAVQVPGWRAVPTKPTEAMLMAGRAVDVERPGGWAMNLGITAVGDIYRAMLNAAPLQPLAGGEAQA